MAGLDTQLISTLILPPAGPLLVGLLGLLLWRIRFGRELVIFSLLVQLGLSMPVTAEWLLNQLQTTAPFEQTQGQEIPAQAIVVLGAGRYRNAPEYHGDTASLRMLSRLRYAARLAQQTGLPVIASGGRPDREGKPEAQIAREILTGELGVQVLTIDDSSSNTWENAGNIIDLMQQHHLDQVILITDAAHMPRALYAFEQQGALPIPAPINFEYRNATRRAFHERIIPTPTAAMNSALALHEILGNLWYRLKVTLSV
ncbi:MAG: YdcF family protein [Candidatus Thiodiazotropha sp.]